jgi:UDP-glucose 4-epimerase
MRVVITGAAGLIGSNLTKHLLKEGDEVIAVDNLSGGLKENLPDCEFHQIDCGSNMSRIFKGRQIDCVYHLAAYAAEGLSPFIRKFNYTNNLVNTANIVNHCIKYDVGKLVFTSSIAVYGKNDIPFLETDTPRPIDPYGVAKLACEMDIEIANEQHGLPYTIFRPHNVFGVGQNIFDKYRNVLGIWMRQHLAGEALTIFGDGSQTRCFTPIGDLMGPMAEARTKGDGQIYNIGSDLVMSIEEASWLLTEVIDESVKVEYLPARHEVSEAICGHRKVRDSFNCPSSGFVESLREMWEWAKRLPKREPVNFEYEITNSIYNAWK